METLTHAPVLARFGYAVSDPTRAEILLALTAAPSYPSELADSLGVSRQSMSNHLTCLRGCGLVVAVPEGRRTRYELADQRLGHALKDLLGRRAGGGPGLLRTRRDVHAVMASLQLSPGPARRAVLSRRIRCSRRPPSAITSSRPLWLCGPGVRRTRRRFGFGLDSIIEVASALALSWQFSTNDPERREHLTLRIIAVSFFALAAFVSAEAIRSLLGAGEAQHSTPGIVIAALSLVISRSCPAQRRAGWELGQARRCLTPRPALHVSVGSPARGFGAEQHLAGGGPMPALRWSSPRSPSGRASTPGAATSAARSRTRRQTPFRRPRSRPAVTDAVPIQHLQRRSSYPRWGWDSPPPMSSMRSR